MSLFMLDTNTASFAIKGHAAIDAKLQDLAPAAWCISAVTCAEMLYGLEKRPEAVTLRRLVHAFLDVARIVPWDHLAAAQHARVRNQLKSVGTPIGDFDEMIAGHALSLGATVVTDSERHFSRVAGLSMANWAREGKA